MPAVTGAPAPRGSRRPTLRALLTGLAAAPLLLAVAACGSSSSGTSPATSSGASTPAPGASVSGASVPATTYPVTVHGDNGDVTVAARPKAIVSLGPTLTEMLFAMGAGSQVKAVDDQSDFPREAPRTKLSAFQPNVEAIAGYQPDLVVLTNDTGGLVAALGKLKVPVLLLSAPTTIAGGYAQEVVLGKVTGHPDEAQRLVDGTKKRIADAVAKVPRGSRPLKIYHELDPTYYSVTGATFIGDLYRQFGMTDIADSSPKAAGGYPQLSAEFVISAAPDVIVLADGRCCHQDAAAVAKRPAFASVPAVTAHRVVLVDDDIASRWGPRLADFAEQIGKTLAASS